MDSNPLIYVSHLSGIIGTHHRTELLVVEMEYPGTFCLGWSANLNQIEIFPNFAPLQVARIEGMRYYAQLMVGILYVGPSEIRQTKYLLLT
jgi:hypothetical protein